MAIGRLYYVICDGCGQRIGQSIPQDTRRRARSLVKLYGWSRPVVGDNALGKVRKDFCPKCLEKWLNEPEKEGSDEHS